MQTTVICQGTAKTGLFRQFFVNISKAFKAVFMAKPSSHNVLEWPEFEHIVLGDLDKGCPPPRQGAACGLSVLLPPQIHFVSARWISDRPLPCPLGDGDYVHRIYAGHYAVEHVPVRQDDDHGHFLNVGARVPVVWKLRV